MLQQVPISVPIDAETQHRLLRVRACRCAGSLQVDSAVQRDFLDERGASLRSFGTPGNGRSMARSTGLRQVEHQGLKVVQHLDVGVTLCLQLGFDRARSAIGLWDGTAHFPCPVTAEASGDGTGQEALQTRLRYVDADLSGAVRPD